MRRLLISGALTFTALVFFFGWAYLQRPAVPAFEPLGPPMELDFAVHGIEDRALELEMTDGPRGNLFLQFEVATEGGQPIVIFNGAGGRSAVRRMQREQELPEWSFLESPDGEPVLNFTFENQLVELEDGTPAVRMVYTGADVPLMRAMKVGRPTTLPPFIGRALGHDGPVQLQRGTYPVDEEAGVTIEARLLGR